jgi:hypothetical protein
MLGNSRCGTGFCWLATPEGIEVDVALGALPFEERCVARASPWELHSGVTLTTCSAEDLLTHKVFAGRGVDWGDAEQVLIRQHEKLNLAQVRAELKPLLELKDQPEAITKLDELITRVNRRLSA